MVSADGGSSAQKVHTEENLHGCTPEALTSWKPAVQVIWGHRQGQHGPAGRHACCQRCGGEQRANTVSWTREESRNKSAGQLWDQGLALDYCSACPDVELLLF